MIYLLSYKTWQRETQSFVTHYVEFDNATNALIRARHLIEQGTAVHVEPIQALN